MLKLIRNEKEFRIVDENSKWSLDLDCDFEKKTGKNYKLEKGKTNLIKFIDNNGFPRFITESKAVDGYTMEYKTEKKSITKVNNSSNNSKWNWLDYATDEEKKKLEEIKNNCIKRHDDEVNNPNYKLLLEQKKLQEKLAEINAKLNKETK